MLPREQIFERRQEREAARIVPDGVSWNPHAVAT